MESFCFIFNIFFLDFLPGVRSSAVCESLSRAVDNKCEEDTESENVSDASPSASFPDSLSIAVKRTAESENLSENVGAEVIVNTEPEPDTVPPLDRNSLESQHPETQPSEPSENPVAYRSCAAALGDASADFFDFLHAHAAGTKIARENGRHRTEETVPDGMSSTSSRDTVNRGAKRISAERAADVGGLTENDDDDDDDGGGRVVERGTVHATIDALADDNSGSRRNDLNECGCWKSLSNDASSHLRKWCELPYAREIMLSLDSSKLDLTGCVPPELCSLKARSCCPCEYDVLEAPSDRGALDSARRSCRDLIFGGRVCGDHDVDEGGRALCVSNLEVIREFSDYFRKSLETDSKLREGIPDLSLNAELGDCVAAPECVFDAFEARYVEDEEAKDDAADREDDDQVTSFVYSSSGSEPSEDEQESAMKNKKKGASNADETAEEDSQRPGILKSALKRGSKKFSRKKHRVQFDESLNKFFEADYVILVRDDEYDDEYGRCECGNQFCYEGCYYEDEDEDEYEHAVDSPRFDFGAAFDPPMEFVDPVTLSPPDGYKDGCCPEPGHKVSTATMTSGGGGRDADASRREGKENEHVFLLDSSC